VRTQERTWDQVEATLLERIARFAIVAPRRIITVAALLLVAATIFGEPVAKSLFAGGFQDPSSESSQATRLLAEKFGQGEQQMVIAITAPNGAMSDQARDVGTGIADQLKRSPGY